MKSTYASRPRSWVPWALVVVLVIGNILSNRVLPDAFYVPVNLAVAAVLVGFALTEVEPFDLGLCRWRRGAVWGSIVVGVGLVAYLTALALPPTRGLFYDSRVAGGFWAMLYEVVIRIPLGTVVLEEVAFRGVLPAVLAMRMSVFRAALWSSLLFGLWHVLPSLGLRAINPVLGAIFGSGVVGQFAGVAFAVGGTFLLGLWMMLLRHGSGSLLAPVIAHIGSNSGAYTLAWLVTGGVRGSIEVAG